MTGVYTPSVVTINRPDVVALIQAAADRLTAGHTTEAVAMAMRALLERNTRTSTLFATHPGSVSGVDLIASVLQDPTDDETGPELGL